MHIQTSIFYLLLIDSLSANLLVMFGPDWYVRHFTTLSRWFPPAKGWALYYLILVLWIGAQLYQIGVLPW